MRSAYRHHQRHAIDHLVNKGHITVNPTSVIRLNSRGLLCARGEEDVPPEMLRKAPRLFQAGADITIQTAARPPLLGSLLKDVPLKRRSPLVEAGYYSGAIAALRSLPFPSHPVWDTLKYPLKKTITSQRSRSALHEELEAACAEEDLDWKRFDFIKRGCHDGPNMMDLGKSAMLLYKLMGVLNPNEDYLYAEALILDEKSADSIYTFLGLLRFIQASREDMSKLYPMLQSKCQDMENLLVTKRGAPKVRQFMEFLSDKAASNDEHDGDGDDQEGEQPSKKRRCTKY